MLALVFPRLAGSLAVLFELSALVLFLVPVVVLCSILGITEVALLGHWLIICVLAYPAIIRGLVVALLLVRELEEASVIERVQERGSLSPVSGHRHSAHGTRPFQERLLYELPPGDEKLTHGVNPRFHIRGHGCRSKPRIRRVARQAGWCALKEVHHLEGHRDLRGELDDQVLFACHVKVVWELELGLAPETVAYHTNALAHRLEARPVV